MSSYRRRTSPRRSRSLSYKKKVLNSVHSVGLSKTLRKLNVTKDQVKSWLRKEDEIRTDSEDLTVKTAARAAYAALEQEEMVLFQWIMERSKALETVYTDEVIGKATSLFVQTGQIRANRRWLGSFKRRFKLFRTIVDRPKPAQVLSAPKPLPAFACALLTPEISAEIDFSPGEGDIYSKKRTNKPIVLDLEASAVPILPEKEVIDLVSTP